MSSSFLATRRWSWTQTLSSARSHGSIRSTWRRVFGWLKEGNAGPHANRWRERHLFQSRIARETVHHASLATGCSVIRKSVTRKVGGFDQSRRWGEDVDLGRETLNSLVFPSEKTETQEQCRLALERNPSDFRAAFRLCTLLRQRTIEELALLENVLKEPGCPQYFLVMKADALAASGDWMGAWETIHKVTAK